MIRRWCLACVWSRGEGRACVGLTLVVPWDLHPGERRPSGAGACPSQNGHGAQAGTSLSGDHPNRDSTQDFEGSGLDVFTRDPRITHDFGGTFQHCIVV